MKIRIDNTKLHDTEFHAFPQENIIFGLDNIFSLQQITSQLRQFRSFAFLEVDVGL